LQFPRGGFQFLMGLQQHIFRLLALGDIPMHADEAARPVWQHHHGDR
jgi:hypothetical protein